MITPTAISEGETEWLCPDAEAGDWSVETGEDVLIMGDNLDLIQIRAGGESGDIRAMTVAKTRPAA
ncbi:hypothetical protein [Paracoccus sp. (in: a-proteobacteria)]|uniref:hypothetical protein n=1 Tax=Paracoccus sp. TaxID=267 RepID=UPI0035AF5273